jgi:hypothetical protein
MSLSSERLDRLGLGNFGAAVLAGAPGIVVPKVEHRLAEMLDDIAAIEIDVFDERATFIAIKDDVLMLVGGPAALDDDADGIRRTDWRMRHIRRDKERLTFADEVIDDLLPFPDSDFDVSLELIKIFFGIDQVKIVPRIRAFDDHDKEIAPVVEVTVADRRLKQVPVCFNPFREIDRGLHLCRCAGSDLRGRW